MIRVHLKNFRKKQDLIHICFNGDNRMVNVDLKEEFTNFSMLEWKVIDFFGNNSWLQSDEVIDSESNDCD